MSRASTVRKPHVQAAQDGSNVWHPPAPRLDWRPAPRPGLPPLAFTLLALAVVVAFTVSGDLLFKMGLNYQLPGGSPLQKFHPATYLLLAATTAYLASGRPASNLARFAVVTPQVGVYLGAVVLLTLYAALVVKLPLAPVIDTWLTPGLLVGLGLLADDAQKRRLGGLVAFVLLLNFGLGLAESVGGFRTVPMALADYIGSGGVLDTTGWREARSTALLGHPLTATIAAAAAVMMTAALLLFERVTTARAAVFAAGLVVLPCFGGRASIAVTVMAVASMFLWRTYLFLKGRPAPLNAVLGSLLVVSALPVVIAVLTGAGFFDPLLERLQDDNGSAGTRIVALQIFASTPGFELLFGDVGHTITSRMRLLGTTYGVEISWLALVLQYGLLCAGGIVGAFFALMGRIARERPLVLWMMIPYAVAASSGVGFASKTLALLQMASIALFLFPQGIPSKGATASPRGVAQRFSAETAEKSAA